MTLEQLAVKDHSNKQKNITSEWCYALIFNKLACVTAADQIHKTTRRLRPGECKLYMSPIYITLVSR